MSEETIEDLKQFITNTIASQSSELIARLDKVKSVVIKIDKKINSLSESVAEALDTAKEAVDYQLKKHERRIKRLERQPA